MLSKAEFLARVGGVHVSRKGNRTALYKPLLMLVLFERTHRFGVRSIEFATIEFQLRSLISRYSPDDSPDSVGQPWWHLPTDSLWQVRDETGRIVRESGRPREGHVPSLEDMRRQSGEFPDEIAELLQYDLSAVTAAVDQVVAVFFATLDPASRDELLLAAGASE